MRWFEIALVSLTFLTGLIWLIDRLFFAKRRAGADGLLDESKEPVVVDYARAFFPVLAFVLVLRSFIAEPFRIPSSSMMPTLLIGDFILVNKFAYGLRWPISNEKFIEIDQPQRGDVVVFRYMGRGEGDPNRGIDYIKRVIGLPGDTVTYRDNRVTVNNQTYTYQVVGEYQADGPSAEMNGATEMIENLPGRPHPVLEITNIPHIDQGEGEWTVPKGHYLVMGDNRDRSDDGRFWGTLPEEQLRGKAFLIWLNCKGFFCRESFETSRIGDSIL
jgi:signal peptidase I